jgi:hypothetical protein
MPRTVDRSKGPSLGQRPLRAPTLTSAEDGAVHEHNLGTLTPLVYEHRTKVAPTSPNGCPIGRKRRNPQ